jgi:hypothetical protein
VSSSDKRRAPREKCYAKALFIDDEAPGYVRDISEAGVRVDKLGRPNASPGQWRTIRVLPEEETEIPPFRVRIQVRWVRREELFYAIGASVHPPEDAGAATAYHALLDLYADDST